MSQQENFKLAEARGFHCVLCRRRPPNTIFNYENSGRFCYTCIIAPRILPWFALFVLLHIIGSL